MGRSFIQFLCHSDVQCILIISNKTLVSIHFKKLGFFFFCVASIVLAGSVFPGLSSMCNLTKMLE